MKRANAVLAAVSAFALTGVTMAGAPVQVVVDVTNTNSWDGLGSPNNETIDVILADFGMTGSGWSLEGVGWDVTIDAGPTPDGESWLSEAAIAFGNLGSDADIILSVGVGDDAPGVASYTEPMLLFSDAGLANIALPSGVLHMEFFESFDDIPDMIDANWRAGTLTLQFVPAPGAIALLGLAGLVSRRRRR